MKKVFETVHTGTVPSAHSPGHQRLPLTAHPGVRRAWGWGGVTEVSGKPAQDQLLREEVQAGSKVYAVLWRGELEGMWQIVPRLFYFSP